MVDLRKPPYFSTFDESQKFYRILARPGRPIQVREWNDLQEQLQKQVERIGAHLFENGAQVLPGADDAVTYRNNIGFIKLSKASSRNLDENAIKNLWLGKVIRSSSAPSGIQAKVIGYKVLDTLGEVRLFVDYITADSTTGASTAFVAGQSIETVEDVPSVAVLSTDLTSIGLVSGVFIKKSVYFFNGDFILVDEQSVILDPVDSTTQESWNNLPTAKVGLSVVRTIVSFQEDETLGDNANPSENFGAPGADRLHIEAILQQRAYTEENDGQFIDLLRVANGVVQERVRRTAYSVISDTLARRTFDESGDYTVRPFPLTVRSFLKEGGNDGVHVREEYQYATQAEAEVAGERIFGVRAASPDPIAPSKWLPAASEEDFIRLARGKLTLQIDPGKAYVKGYEIEKLAPSYVDIDKARTTKFQNNRTVNPDLGTYVFITNVYGAPKFEQYERVHIHRKRKSSNSDLNPNEKIGAARVLAIEYFSGTHGAPDAIYQLFLFDIEADQGAELSQMKSISTTTGDNFSADLSLEFAPLEGSVQDSTGNDIVGFGTSFENRPSQRISKFDYIRIGNNNNQIYQVAERNSDTSLTLTTAPTFSGNQAIEYAFCSFRGLESAAGLVFNLPEQFIYTIRSANSDNSINDDAIDTVFSVKRAFNATSNNSGVIEIATTLADEEFEDFSPTNYLAIDTSNGNWLRLVSGNSFVAGGAEEGSLVGVQVVATNQVKIYANPAHQGRTYYIVASVRKTQGFASKEKKKTLIRGTFNAGAYTGPSVVTAGTRSDLGTISLQEADILKVTRVVMSPNFETEPSALEVLPSGHTDVTSRYLVDNGQRDYYYGIGSIYLKPGVERPKGRIRVEFDYFTHSGQGSYFSVDSYPFKGTSVNMDYSEIPTFTDSSGRLYNLRDCLDFRPRLNASNAFVNYLEVPDSNIRLDFHHYLHRTDNLYLDKLGVFRVARGTPDIEPVSPEEPGDAMSLYLLDLQAYTATPDQCYKRRIDNRRFTMRDIGRIEQRVTNLEYYTLLSLLEKETKELEVKDAQGLDRFKNGFIVDNFKDHGIGNLSNADYRCSVDPNSEELRPSIYQNSIDLIETASLQSNTVVRDTKRSQNNYTRTGKLFTLPYQPVKFIEQQLASQVENVNPYAKFTFRGRIKLDPATDTWRDTKTLPKIEVYDDSAFKAAQAGVNPNEVIWGEWERGKSHVDKQKEKYRKTVKLGPNKPDAVHSQNWPRYVEKGSIITTTTTTQEIRKGISQSVVDKGVKTESLGKRVVSISAADYMRSREVKIEARGFLPSAVLYPFFNDESVSQFCKPVGGILGQTIRADGTGSVDLVFTIPPGRFLCGERIFKLTTSQANASNPQPASDGETKYYAVGWIDNVQETELQIRQFDIQRTEKTDTRIDVDVDVEKRTKVVKEDPIAQSFTIQEKGGCFITAVDVFFYSKDPLIPIKLQLRPLSDDGNPTIFIMPFGEVVKPAADVVTNYFDPVTGKLTVTGNGTVQGYTVGPWSDSTSNPNLIERVTNASGREVPNGVAFSSNEPHRDMIPTRFVFESPIYVKEGNDYAIVLLADSTEYQAWVSQSGTITPRPGGVPVFGKDINTIIGTTTPILQDNFLAGVFFRSSNGTTWNADQNVDMKFAIHKANFLTNNTGVIEYVNEELPVRVLDNQPLETFAGTRKIRVHHKNHGHPAFASPPSRVVLSNVTSAHGMTVSLINRAEGWPIESVELDSYVIDVTGSVIATESGRTGGVGVTASESVSMDSMFLNANSLSFPETSILWSYSTTNGGNVSYADPNPKAMPFVVNAFLEMEPNTTIGFPNPMTVSSKINENNSGDTIQGPSKVTTNNVGDRKSLRLRAVLRSFNPNLSPVLDADRLAVIAVANRINNVTGSGLYSINTAADTIDIVPNTLTPAVTTTANLIYFYGSDAVAANKGRIKTDDPDIAQHLSKLDVGKLVTITGAAGTSRNLSDIKVLEVVYTPDQTPKCTVVFDATFGGTSGLDSGAVVIKQKDHFIDEIAPEGGSAAFKYVSKQLSLARQSTALKISFDANRHFSNEIEVYYKVLRADSKVPFEDLNWTKATFNVENNGQLVEAYPEPNSLENQVSEYSATVEGLPPFIGVSVKLVGKGGNSARPPRISNLKVIALDE